MKENARVTLSINSIEDLSAIVDPKAWKTFDRLGRRVLNGEVIHMSLSSQGVVDKMAALLRKTYGTAQIEDDDISAHG